MSKLVLQKRVYQTSGVSHEDAQRVFELEESVFDRLGFNGLRRLSELFYDAVYREEPWFLNIFSSSTRQEAIENFFCFLVQTFGGPDLYRQRKGSKYTRLSGRHAAYNIGVRAAERWVQIMVDAMDKHEVLARDDKTREALTLYFRYQAHYIVVASEYMRPDQVRARRQQSATPSQEVRLLCAAVSSRASSTSSHLHSFFS